MPVNTKAKLVGRVLKQKEKVLFRCCAVLENEGLPVSKLISSAKPNQNPATLSKTKTKGRAQNYCPILKYHPMGP